MRLQRFLAQAGIASRRQAEDLIASGAVRVNGEVVTGLGVQVDDKKDKVEVKGRRVRPEAPLYRLLLKPRGCLATLAESAGVEKPTKAPDRPDAAAAKVAANDKGRLKGGKPGRGQKEDTADKPGRGAKPVKGGAKAKPSRVGAEEEVTPEKHRQTLARYVDDPELGWKVVAPLDYPAEGVLLLTTDGELAQQLSRGGGKVLMTYHLKFQGKVGPAEVERLRRGWKWEGRPVKPKAVEAVATTGKNTWVEMVISETRARVLKAGGDTIRRPLLKVSRVRLGELSFEGLEMGGSRELSKVEAASLRRSAGLPG